MGKIDQVKKGVDELRSHLLIKEPEHFSAKDIVSAFFGALFLGMTFSIKGLLIRISQGLNDTNVALIILSTLVILTAEIYFIGYSRVTKKPERKFGQFWIKRIFAFYLVALITSLFLVYVFGLNHLQEIANIYPNIFKLVILISMPCAIGAAVADLLKKY